MAAVFVQQRILAIIQTSAVISGFTRLGIGLALTLCDTNLILSEISWEARTSEEVVDKYSTNIEE